MKRKFYLTCDEYLVLHFPQSLQDLRIENKIKKPMITLEIV